MNESQEKKNDFLAWNVESSKTEWHISDSLTKTLQWCLLMKQNDSGLYLMFNIVKL